jgi:hypothetical protein
MASFSVCGLDSFVSCLSIYLQKGVLSTRYLVLVVTCQVSSVNVSTVTVRTPLERLQIGTCNCSTVVLYYAPASTCDVQCQLRTYSLQIVRVATTTGVLLPVQYHLLLGVSRILRTPTGYPYTVKPMDRMAV